MTQKVVVYLDDFGANLEGARAELLARAVRILSVDHADVGTASRRDHLMKHGHTQSGYVTRYIREVIENRREEAQRGVDSH